MDFFENLISALPTAATSPLAFTAYVLVIAAWVVIALRVNRNRQLLDNIEKLPESDRLQALQLEMGAVQVRSGLTADQWLRSRLHVYYFLGFCLLCVAGVVVFAIAMATLNEPRTAARASAPADAAFTGDWHAAFKDPDYARDGEQFYFRLNAQGGKVFGTATRVYNPDSDQSHGYSHAISDGKVEGNVISFWFIGETKHNDGAGNETGLKDLFSGTISGDAIHFVYQVEDGIHPVEFIARRITTAGDRKTDPK